MRKQIGLAIPGILISLLTVGQHPLKHWTEAFDMRYSSQQPGVDYILTVDPRDTSSFSIEMKITNIPDTFRVAMVAHPEYDDRYWRYVEDFSVRTKTGNGVVRRVDSALWQIITDGRQAILRYKIRLPGSEDQFRSSWKAFLTSNGGLVGGPHSFMYIVGATLVPSHITMQIPEGWDIATGLTPTVDPKTFFAPSVGVLVDDPILIGTFKKWSFNTAGVPHRVVYLSLPGAKKFDSVKLVEGLQKVVGQAHLLFRGLPYRDYTFMLQDGALGSLEHNNSVTVGAPASQLAQDAGSIFPEIAHEYFHTWNLVRIRPVEYADVSYKTPPLSKGLWFSEGLTIFYSDLLMRRAGLPVFDSTRIVHLQNLIRRYSQSPAYLKYSAETISLASYGPVGMLGDYSGSTHLQGEVLGAILDLIIRDATNGRRSMDDVMRKMLEKFSAEKGFTSADVEKTIQEVCGCSVHELFLAHVFGTKQIDFNRWLRLIGLQSTMAWKDVLMPDGRPSPDLRVYSRQDPNENFVRLGITNPGSSWARAGLHTGDRLIALNGTKVNTTRDFRQLIREVQLADTVVVEVERSSRRMKVNVLVSGYQQPEVHINQITATTEKQKRLLEDWINGRSF